MDLGVAGPASVTDAASDRPSAIALRKCQDLTVTTAVVWLTLVNLGGCELSGTALATSSPEAGGADTSTGHLTMIWKARACLRTNIFVHRSDGRTTNDLAGLMA